MVILLYPILSLLLPLQLRSSIKKKCFTFSPSTRFNKTILKNIKTLWRIKYVHIISGIFNDAEIFWENHCRQISSIFEFCQKLKSLRNSCELCGVRQLAVIYAVTQINPSGSSETCGNMQK